MTTQTSQARALAALGHDARLSIFRLLVKTGHSGLRVGDIGAMLDLAPSTLAHHLSTLVDANLVVQEKHGREVFSKAHFDVIEDLVAFLTAECCQGVTPPSLQNSA
ncbi:metalloregulator ArsR/SmtB family transcription factor [Phaeobacter sp.]|uniref:ArsR/SmtB family transcription factor n=1 Tax=Phaeobacter sp. TaxID=1902409 RepID=UPI0025DEF585|nr:metalloregulator ArsR/SmtB family transcription factor [Phaeobacter sp.]